MDSDAVDMSRSSMGADQSKGYETITVRSRSYERWLVFRIEGVSEWRKKASQGRGAESSRLDDARHP